MSGSLLAKSFDIVVVGGGAGGLAVSSQLLRKNRDLSIAIVEPSSLHYYQPGFTLVGSGVGGPVSNFTRNESSLIPKDATWVQSKVVSFQPDQNEVTTEKQKLKYKYLVVAPGLETKWNAIKGLTDALEDTTSGVGSIYSPKYVMNVTTMIQRGFLDKEAKRKAIFTQAPMPIKCAGAPQKIMYMAEYAWRKQGVRDKYTIDFYTALPVLFSQHDYNIVLNKICDERKLDRHYGWDLVEVRPDKKEAVFQKVSAPGETKVVNYDFLHVTPKQGAFEFMKKSPIVDSTGFVDVNSATLQHKKFPNVFSLGDASNLPTSKTAAAVAGEAPVLVSNLLSHMEGKPLSATYDGYTSCPLLVGDHKLLLAEFIGPGYGGTRKESFWFDQLEPRVLFYFLKTEVLPPLYWHGLLKGRWKGPNQLPWKKK